MKTNVEVREKMRAYTLVGGETRMYTLEASISNIANFIMSQPISCETIVFTDLDNCVVCTTMGQFLDYVPNQQLVPLLHKYLLPMQLEGKKPQIELPQSMLAGSLDIHRMRDRLPAMVLSAYLYDKEMQSNERSPIMANKKEKSMKYKSPYGDTANVRLWVGAYENNGSLYIGLIDIEEEEDYGDITVNMDESIGLKPYCAAVKNYGGNEGMEMFIQKYALGKPTGIQFSSGYVTVPVYQFDKARLLEFSLNGVREYDPEQ